MATHPIHTAFDDDELKALDDWRGALSPSPSRAEALRAVVRRYLCPTDDQATLPTPSPMACPSADTLAALYALSDVRGFGPIKFRDMHRAGVDPRKAIEQSEVLPFTGLTREKLRTGIHALGRESRDTARRYAHQQLEYAKSLKASILTHGHPLYPKLVYESNNPVPVLYVRGDPSVWRDRRTVALVGSRHTRDPYCAPARAFAHTAVSKEVVIVSGFAMGADSIGHTAARDGDGYTVCVMPCGLDKVFPPENRPLWEELLDHPGAVFVSEFPFGQRASTLQLRKRNKLIAAFAQGVVVVQTGLDGGAMNAYRSAREQRKQVATFEPDDTTFTEGNAAISEDPRTGSTAFSLNATQSEYAKWLDGLSSSI